MFIFPECKKPILSICIIMSLSFKVLNVVIIITIQPMVYHHSKYNSY